MKWVARIFTEDSSERKKGSNRRFVLLVSANSAELPLKQRCSAWVQSVLLGLEVCLSFPVLVGNYLALDLGVAGP
uniref:Uncharacterized protein n=1 Tax=Tetraselmis sp. GSL018 TaxID=582737 RepID=A0A061RNG0_9CHLO